MKIVYVLKTLSKGGAERVISNLANYSINKGDEVYIITLIDSKIEYKLNSKVSVITCGGGLNKFSKVFSFFHLVKFIRKKLSEISPDIILSFLPQANFVTLLANRNKFSTIISARNDHKIEFPNRKYKFLMRWLYPKADAFIFQTGDQKKYFEEIGLKKMHAIIPNPIDDDFVVEPYKGKREKNIVSIGRLVRQKNQKLLIESFSEIYREYNDYKLIIYGEGKLKDELNKYIMDLKLDNSVMLAGNVDNIKEKIYKSSLFVLSSDFEGMPNSLMEAMALGVPSISTDCPCGGPKTLIENGVNGVLVEVNNKVQMVNAIKKVLDDEEFSRKISLNAHSNICEKYNSRSTYERYYHFFTKVIKEKNKK